MTEESQKPILLPHHEQNSLCTTRLPYRQGRKLTAVKVYTITNESKHLLVFGVPSLNLRQETKALFLKFGKLLQFYITKYPSEPFTETYHAVFENIQCARLAKRMLDTKNFYGGHLHVCYAPELESIEETREKLLLRQKNVIARLINLNKAAKEVPKNSLNTSNDVVKDNKNCDVKMYMGDVNNIQIGENKTKKTMKRFKINKSSISKTSEIKKKKISNDIDNIKSGNDVLSNDSIVGPKNITTINCAVSSNANLSTNIYAVAKNNCAVTTNTDAVSKNINAVAKNTNTVSTNIEVVDFTSPNIEILTNINESLNYDNFGKELIRQVPYKPVNKIKFNINKNSRVYLVVLFVNNNVPIIINAMVKIY